MRSHYLPLPDYPLWPNSFYVCKTCHALVHDTGLTFHSDWHGPVEVEVPEPVLPDFKNNTVWLDSSGHPWLAQLDPDIEDRVVILLVSSLGSCTVAEAVQYYGPTFTQIGGFLT